MRSIPFEKLAFNVPTAVFIRHAEKFDLDYGPNGLKVPLTEKGREDAFRIGKTFPLKMPLHIYHSPVSRCGETAEALLKGLIAAGRFAELKGELRALGGPSIKGGREQMLREMQCIGDKFTEQWLDGKLPKGLLHSAEETALGCLRVVADQFATNESCVSFINITHDWNILAFRDYFFKSRCEAGFLDGFAVQKSGTVMKLFYKDEERFTDSPY